MQGLWDELWSEGTNVTINTRFLRLFFIDVDADLEDIAKEVVDGSIPYDIITVETGERFEVISSSVVSDEGVGNDASWWARDEVEKF